MKSVDAHLVEAAGRGNLENVQSMLQGDNPVDLDCRYRAFYGDNAALYKICSGRGNVAMVQIFRRAGADVNQKMSHQSNGVALSRMKKW